MRRRGLLLAALTLVLAGLLTACAGRPELPRPEEITFPPLTFQIPEVNRETLPGGIRLYWKQDRELPLVTITVQIGSGSIAEPAEKTGLGALFAAALRTGGTVDRTPEELDRALERLAADLSVGVDSYRTTLHLSVHAEDLEAGLGLLGELLRRPAFADDRVELARRQVLEGLRRRNDRPGPIAHRAFGVALYHDHPLGRFPTEKTVDAITREDLIDFHRRYFAPTNLWLGISGDFEPERLKELLGKTFDGWQEPETISQEIPPLPPAPGGGVVLVRKDIPQTTIVMGEIGIDKDAPDQYAVRVLNFILGGGGFNSRMMREIRSNRGLAYSVYSHFDIGTRLPGPFFAGAETKASTTVEVAQLMRSLMTDLTREPVTAEELRLAKDSLINSFIFAFEDSHEVVSRAIRLDFFHYPPDYLQNFRDRIAAVTAEDVLDAARRHLHPDRQQIVLVGNPEAFDQPPETLGPVTEKKLDEL